MLRELNKFSTLVKWKNGESCFRSCHETAMERKVAVGSHFELLRTIGRVLLHRFAVPLTILKGNIPQTKSIHKRAHTHTGAFAYFSTQINAMAMEGRRW